MSTPVCCRLMVCDSSPNFIACEELTEALLSQAIGCRGQGIVMTILAGLADSHAAHLEDTKHGLFIKLHYRRSQPERKPSPHVTERVKHMHRTRYDRETLLRATPPGLNYSVKNTFIHVAADGDTNSLNSEAASAPGCLTSAGSNVCKLNSTADTEQPPNFFIGDCSVDAAVQTEFSKVNDDTSVRHVGIAIETNDTLHDAGTQTRQNQEEDCINALKGEWLPLCRQELHLDAAVQAGVEQKEAECTADQNTIFRETECTRPEASFRAEMQAKINQHQDRYPGGQLPFELRSFSEFMERKKKWMSSEQLQVLKCHFCGKIT